MKTYPKLCRKEDLTEGPLAEQSAAHYRRTKFHILILWLNCFGQYEKYDYKVEYLFLTPMLWSQPSFLAFLSDCTLNTCQISSCKDMYHKGDCIYILKCWYHFVAVMLKLYLYCSTADVVIDGCSSSYIGLTPGNKYTFRWIVAFDLNLLLSLGSTTHERRAVSFNDNSRRTPTSCSRTVLEITSFWEQST